MSNNPLIINIRKQLNWRQRFFSDSSTALMWGMWLYLWRPIVVISSVHVVTHPIVHVVTKISPSTMGYIIATVICGAAGLLLWTLLPARRVKPIAHKTLTDYARHFHLPKQEIIAGREANICTVYHDEHGKIIGITPQKS